MMIVGPIPKPKVSGVGRIQYRCASCAELMEPEEAVLVEDLDGEIRSYHPAHLPEDPDGR